MPWDSVLKKNVEVPPGASWDWDKAGRVVLKLTPADVQQAAAEQDAVSKFDAEVCRMGRPRKHVDNAEKQRAYRARKKQAQT